MKNDYMSDDVKKCIELLERNMDRVELVSYGLAPNPFGFCYEIFGEVIDRDALDESLEELSDEDACVIRGLYL